METIKYLSQDFDKIIIAQDLIDKNYLFEIIKTRSNESIINLRNYVNFNNYKIKEIYWKYLKNRPVGDIKIDINYGNIIIKNYSSNNYAPKLLDLLDLLDISNNNNTYQHHKNILKNIFYENFENLNNIKDIIININNEIELLIIYENILNKVENFDIFEIQDLLG